MSYINLTKSGNKNIDIICDNLTALETVSAEMLDITGSIETISISAINVNATNVNTTNVNSVDISANDISCNNLEADNNIVSNNTMSCTDFTSVTRDSDNLTSIDCTISNDLSANQVYSVQSVALGSLGPILIESGEKTWVASDTFGDNPLTFLNLSGNSGKMYLLFMFGFITPDNTNFRFTINYNFVVTGTDYQGNVSNDGSFLNYTNNNFARLIEPNRASPANMTSTTYIKAARDHSETFQTQSSFYIAATGAGGSGTADSIYLNSATSNMTTMAIDVSNANHAVINVTYRLMRYY